MSAEVAVLTHSWLVGPYRVTLTVQHPVPGRSMHCSCEWEPSLPERLTEEEVCQYVRGRDAALCELSRQLGVRVLMPEAKPC